MPAFVSEATLLAARPDGLDMDLHLVLPPSAYHPGEFDLIGAVNRASTDMRAISFDIETQATRLADQIRRDQRLVGIGVTVAATQLVVLCWFALFLAVRHTSDERRPDIGLLKLRGTRRWRIWALTAQQSALPMVVGAVLGWGLGYLAAAALAGDLAGLAATVDTDPARTLRLSMLAAAGACVGALVAAVVAEWRSLRSPVVGLLRRVPARHRGWRAEVFDLVVVVLAAVGVYQGTRTEASSGGTVDAGAARAGAGRPGGRAAGRPRAAVARRPIGGAALRAGRAGAALTALHLARRPGTHRVFAVLAVASPSSPPSLVFWHTATDAWADRADPGGRGRPGADRPGRQQHRPAGGRARGRPRRRRIAMAVARTFGPTSEDRVLAVDTARLATVAARAARVRPGGCHPAAPRCCARRRRPVTHGRRRSGHRGPPRAGRCRRRAADVPAAAT